MNLFCVKNDEKCFFGENEKFFFYKNEDFFLCCRNLWAGKLKDFSKLEEENLVN